MSIESKGTISTQITEAQIYLTRRCNLQCSYCKLTKQHIPELSLEEWKRGYDNLLKIGIKTVKLLGGEPTLKKWLPDLITYSNRIEIKTALLSNSNFSYKKAEQLVDAGLWGYFASIDSLNEINEQQDFQSNRDKSSSVKTGNGYRMLQTLKTMKVPLLAANVVIHAINFYEIKEIVKRLSGEGYYVNLCTIQHTTNKDKTFSNINLDKTFLLSNIERDEIIKLSEELIEMKNSGYRISIPETYLKNMPTYGVKCNWLCSEPLQLRIDSDGGLMLCNEFRTELAKKFNIKDLDNTKLKSFIDNWFIVRKSIQCDGCYWSCFIQAQDNIKNKQLEFHYFEDSNTNRLFL